MFEEIFFRGGHLNGRNFDENFLTEAKAVVNVASLKKVTIDEIRRAIKKIDRNKGIDPYNWHPRLNSSEKARENERLSSPSAYRFINLARQVNTGGHNR